jgi:hypothetical protein
VRRRAEAAFPRDAARGEQSDVIVAEKPARGLGDVTCVTIVGEKANERLFSSNVKSREEKREQRLRDASVTGGVEKRPDAIALGERYRECVEDGWVHSSCRNRVPREAC